MKKEIADLWVQALRDPKYKQTTNCLENASGNCCLGVLCRVVHENGRPLEIKKHLTTGLTSFNGMTGSLPDAVAQWAGMDYSGIPQVTHKDYGTRSMVELNDNMNLTFGQIADIIEQSWETIK